ncbi:MAG: SH3 domain-containing protein [Planctomycetota bacterium]|jgi:hypothetical protein
MSYVVLAIALLLPAQDEEKDQPEFIPGARVTIKTLRAQLRPRASMLARPIRSLARGTEVVVKQVRGTWVQITVGGKEGWVPKSSIMPKEKYDLKEAEKKIDPDNPNATRGGAGTEAAAAKGFNPQIEGKRRKDDAKIDAAYKELDKLQSIVPRKDTARLLSGLEAFRKEGGLGEFKE